MRLTETAMRRFARLVTNAVLAKPGTWRVFRPFFRRQWDLLAPSWDQQRRPDSFAPYIAGLTRVAEPPRRALDIGTGTGGGARAIAERFPTARVVGVDFSYQMIAEATSLLPPALAERVSFRQADAASLPFDDGEFALVTHSNMIPFFDELTRVVSPGGYVLFAFSSGPDTPIYVPPHRLQAELERRQFVGFTQMTAGRGTAVVARKAGGTSNGAPPIVSP